MVGTGYSATLAATGGSTPYGWQVTSGALPAGLSLNLSTGVISGTPTNAVTATVTITLTDANTASTSAVFSLRILSAALAITTAAQLPDGTVGTAYSTTLAATGGTMPYRWQVTSGALPAGLSLNLNTGIISGTPTSATTGNPMISVTDANNVTTSAGFSLRTLSAPLAITTASQLPQGVVGAAYSATLSATGGTTPYRWQVTSGALPAGLSLNLNTGVISGTPTASSTASMSISVTDANSVSTSAIFGLTVNASGNGWQLVWSDEFDGTTLNTAKWLNPDTGNGCNGYTQSSIVEEDSYLDGNGNLVIRAKSQASGGCGPNHYTSGQISTKGRFTQAYGKFEFRAQMPAGGGGIWPGLWLVPFNAWPPEIDVLETVSDMSTVYMNYHWTQNGHQEALASYSNPGLATGFHTYAVEWEPGIINWYIDGVQARPAVTGSHVTNIPMGVLIDIYLGGWAGGVSAPLPQHMLVDYVRVYSRQ
jgi:beta-glucanase (GH16 family)